MSTGWLNKPPAFAGLKRATPELRPADQAERDRICRATGLSGDLYRIRTSARPPYGHFVLGTDQGDYFIKVTEDVELGRPGLTEAILSEAQGSSNAIIPNDAVLSLDDGLRITVQRHIQSRPPLATTEDAGSVAKALATLHTAFAGSPFESEVRFYTAERHRKLAGCYADILRSGVLPGPYPVALSEFPDGPGFDFDLMDDAQIIHGDMNLGNILIREGTQEVFFIDFENVAVSFLSPLIDVGMALQRQILVSDRSDDEKEDALHSFLLSYNQCMPGHTRIDPVRLVHLMNWTCMRNICILAASESDGVAQPETEWRKFLDLANLNRSWASAIKRIGKQAQ